MMMKQDLGLLILRVGIGGIMLFAHGWGKLASFTKLQNQFPDPLGVGSTLSLGLVVFAEFFCALAIILGIFTRWAAIPLLITMLVAAFVIHGSDPFAKKEMALLFAIPLVTLILTGGGRFSLQSFISKARP